MASIIGLCVVLIGMMGDVVPVQAQSFNCRLARSPDEVAICQDAELSQLDEQMSSLYFSVRNRESNRGSAELEHEQVDWLASRRVCGRDFRCLRAAYNVRINDLKVRAR